MNAFLTNSVLANNLEIPEIKDNDELRENISLNAA